MNNGFNNQLPEAFKHKTKVTRSLLNSIPVDDCCDFVIKKVLDGHFFQNKPVSSALNTWSIEYPPFYKASINGRNESTAGVSAEDASQ